MRGWVRECVDLWGVVETTFNVSTSYQHAKCSHGTTKCFAKIPKIRSVFVGQFVSQQHIEKCAPQAIEECAPQVRH